MRILLQGMGFEFTGKASDDAAAFAVPFNGRIVTLLSHGKSIQLSTCFEGDVAPIKENQWNREHFSTRAYLDEQGCGSLGADVKFGGRVTDEMIVAFIGEFFTDVTVYARFVTGLPPAPDTPSAPAVAGSADRSTSPIGPMEWSQLGQNKKSVPPWRDAAGSVPGLLKINRNVTLRYDRDRWRQTAPNKDGQLSLGH
jgi:hypothetical protein